MHVGEYVLHVHIADITAIHVWKLLVKRRYFKRMKCHRGGIGWDC